MNLCQSVMAKGLGTRFTRIDSAVFAHGIIRTQGAIPVLISGAIGNLKKRYHQCQHGLRTPCPFTGLKISCARPKIYLHIVADKKMIYISKMGFLCRHKRFWRGTKSSQSFGLAQKIWTGTINFWDLWNVKAIIKFYSKKYILNFY